MGISGILRVDLGHPVYNPAPVRQFQKRVMFRYV
jgi:hypothetical protein